MSYYNAKPSVRMPIAVDLLNEGMTYREVANSMGLTVSQVKYLFQKYCDEGNTLREAQHGKIKKIMDVFKEEPACSFTAYQVSCILGLAVGTVRTNLSELRGSGHLKRVYQGHYVWSGEDE